VVKPNLSPCRPEEWSKKPDLSKQRVVSLPVTIEHLQVIVSWQVTLLPKYNIIPGLVTIAVSD